jgi:hypothetical protein
MGSRSVKSEEISLETLKALGIEQLAHLVMEGCDYHPQFAERVKRTLAAATNPKALISLIKKQLTRLSREKKFYFAGESGDFATELSDICQAIIDELAPIDVSAAIELAQKFLSLNGKVFERVDDSYGNIWPIFDGLLAALASLYLELGSYNRKILAEAVFDWYCYTDYAIYDNVIEYFAPVLESEGLSRLEELLKEKLESTASEDIRTDFARRKFTLGLLAIADARKDVDQYIAILETVGQAEASYHQLEIAERLIKANRCEEALKWVEKVENSSRFEQEKRELTIQAREGLGQFKEAQTVRIEQFIASPSKKLYEECLDRAEDVDRLQEQLLSAATSHPSLSQSLAFLIEVDELARAAELVRQNRQQWDGKNYHTLQPAAKKLEKGWPVEASILYRALIDDILARAQSKYYHHAVRYLKALETLAPQILDWGELSSHQVYFEHLRETHKRKTALWDKYKL